MAKIGRPLGTTKMASQICISCHDRRAQARCLCSRCYRAWLGAGKELPPLVNRRCVESDILPVERAQAPESPAAREVLAEILPDIEEFGGGPWTRWPDYVPPTTEDLLDPRTKTEIERWQKNGWAEGEREARRQLTEASSGGGKK